MQVFEIGTDLFVAVGETYAANSTVIIDGERVLLIDGMASRADAEALRVWIETDLKKQVRMIVSSHYFSDHIAALGLFPSAVVIAHSLYLHTWASEQFRSDEEASYFVEPSLTFDGPMSIRWGRYRLELFHNPGHTLSTIGIDIPAAYLLHVGDTVVGNIAYIRYSPPELLKQALTRARDRGRPRILSSHGTPRDAKALDDAMTYLDNLTRRAAELAASGRADAITEIRLLDCLAPGLAPIDYEEAFHARNLDTLRSAVSF